ncbi:hypothetical protein B0D95_00310 [Cellvibrio sp. PSBB023]|nr:hypothetical protein B0D95_00310 [Cellvibrio sp. PSBB023]
MYFDARQNTQAPRAREDGVVKAEGITMIEAIYAKRSDWLSRVKFWDWNQRWQPELTRATMLEF